MMASVSLLEAAAENLVDQLPKMSKTALLDLVHLLKGIEKVSSSKDVKAVIVAEIVDKLVKDSEKGDKGDKGDDNKKDKNEKGDDNKKDEDDKGDDDEDPSDSSDSDDYGMDEESFYINVKMPSGEDEQFVAYEDMRISTLKANIALVKGFKMSHFRLLFKGEELDFHKTLDDYKIVAGSTVNLLVRGAGGAGNKRAKTAKDDDEIPSDDDGGYEKLEKSLERDLNYLMGRGAFFHGLSQRVSEIKNRPGVSFTGCVRGMPLDTVKDIVEATKNKRATGVAYQITKVAFHDILQTMKDSSADAVLGKRCMTHVFAAFFSKEFADKRKRGTVDWVATCTKLENIHYEMIAAAAAAAGAAAAAAARAPPAAGPGLEEMDH